MYLFKIVFDKIFQERCTKEGNVKLLSRLSVQFSCSVMFDSLQTHESQHARPPCPSDCRRIKYNCFKICWFLPQINMSQLQVYICPLPLETPSHPSKLSQGTWLSSLYHIATSYQLFILHVVIYIFQCYSLNSSYPLLFPLCSSAVDEPRACYKEGRKSEISYIDENIWYLEKC